MRPLKLRMKGFGAFREETEVDFEGVELAALVGATGSGKSTIIDGVTFALFGSVARYDNASLVAPVINQLTTEARVSLDFEVGGERYSAVRVVRRTANGATTKEARLEHGETVLAGQAREMAPAVETLLGLDFDRFTKTVVLPQGRFAEFLHDEPRKRQELLRHLLDLGIYSRMGEEARRRAADARAKLDELDSQLEAEAPTDEEVAKLDATAEAAIAAQTDLADVMRDMVRINEVLKAAHVDIEKLDELLQAASAATVPDTVRELAGRVESAQEVLRKAAQAHSDRRTELIGARHRAADGPNAETCRSLLADYRRLEELDNAIDQLRTNEGDTERRRKEAQAALEQADVALSRARDALERVKSVKGAEVLIAQLQAGEPCPVCRQPVVDLPDHDIDTEMERALAAEARLRGERKVSEANFRVANDGFIEAKTRREANEEQRADLAARLSGAPDKATLEADIDGARELDADCSRAEAAEAEALLDMDDAREKLKVLQAEEQAALTEYWRARDGLAARQPPEPSGALLEDWEALGAWAEGQQIGLTTERESAEASRQGAELRRSEALERARGLCAPYCDPGEDSDSYAAGMAGAVERARAAHARAVEERAARSVLENRVEELRAVEAVAAELGRLLRSDGFERWVMQEAVGTLVERANERLLQLSGAQYSFVAEGTSFGIRDHHNADEVRGAKTLSGGETFLASLALALALSDSQAEMASEASPGLDSLFLDEGFGTLDPDTLDVVAAAIEELGAAGRMVCIVTHIREVADRMPVRYEVSKGPVTSSVERVEA